MAEEVIWTGHDAFEGSSIVVREDGIAELRTPRASQEIGYIYIRRFRDRRKGYSLPFNTERRLSLSRLQKLTLLEISRGNVRQCGVIKRLGAPVRSIRYTWKVLHERGLIDLSDSRYARLTPSGASLLKYCNDQQSSSSPS